jgi:diacylglycerol kinase family enzyme
MGIIPRGTANAFSVALGIPTHTDDPQNFAVKAADVILQVRWQQVQCSTAAS